MTAPCQRALTLSMGSFLDDIVHAAKERVREVTVQHVLVDSKMEALDIYEAVKEEDGDLSTVIGRFAAEKSTCGSGRKVPSAKLAMLRGAPGELTFRRGAMAPEFEKYAFESPPGTLVRPFRTQFGWHVMLVNS